MQIAVIFCILLMLYGQAVIMESSSDSVIVKSGRDANLSCKLQPRDVSKNTVECKHGEDLVLIYRKGIKIKEGEDYKDRTTLDDKELVNGTISLTLRNVTKQDEGTHTCSLPKTKEKCIFTLEVEEDAEGGEQKPDDDSKDRGGEGEKPIDSNYSAQNIVAISSGVALVVVLIVLFALWCARRNRSTGQADP